jgi:dynamin-binding protein
MESLVSPNVPATSQSVHLSLSSFDNAQSNISSKTIPRSPPLPPRSPLRPKTATNSPSVVTQEIMSSHTLIVSPESFQLTLSPLTSNDASDKPPSTPLLPASPSHLSPVGINASSSSTLIGSPVAMSKRTHALLELLSSERAYASDLALIRDIHIPLALGMIEWQT